jgi:hypothetical protein
MLGFSRTNERARAAHYVDQASALTWAPLLHTGRQVTAHKYPGPRGDTPHCGVGLDFLRLHFAEGHSCPIALDHRQALGLVEGAGPYSAVQLSRKRNQLYS